MTEPKLKIKNGPLVLAEPFITKPEVAKRVGKSVRCVDEWIKRGWIPFYKVGYSVLFKWSEIEKSLTETARVLAHRHRGRAANIGNAVERVPTEKGMNREPREPRETHNQ